MHWTNLFHSLFPFLFSLFLRVLFFFGTFFQFFDGRKVAANCEWIKYIRSRRAHFFITSFVRCFLSVFLSLLVDCGITVAMSQWTLAPVFYGKSAGILLLVKKIWELSERTLMNVCCVCVCVKCSQPMTKLKIKWNATQSHIKLIIFNEAQNQNSHTHTERQKVSSDDVPLWMSANAWCVFILNIHFFSAQASFTLETNKSPRFFAWKTHDTHFSVLRYHGIFDFTTYKHILHIIFLFVRWVFPCGPVFFFFFSLSLTVQFANATFQFQAAASANISLRLLAIQTFFQLPPKCQYRIYQVRMRNSGSANSVCVCVCVFIAQL